MSTLAGPNNFRMAAPILYYDVRSTACTPVSE